MALTFVTYTVAEVVREMQTAAKYAADEIRYLAQAIDDARKAEL